MDNRGYHHHEMTAGHPMDPNGSSSVYYSYYPQQQQQPQQSYMSGGYPTQQPTTTAATTLPPPSHHHPHHYQHSYSHSQMVHHQPVAAAAPAPPPPPPPGYEWSRHSSTYIQQPAAAEYAANSTMIAHSKMTNGGGAQSLRTKITERLQQIDREAFETEERAYLQKVDEVQTEIAMLLRGTHPTFMDGIERLSVERDLMINSANQHHQYLVDMHKRSYNMDRERAGTLYRTEKRSVYDKIAADIEDRRKRLKEEKDNLDINMEFVFESGSRTSSKRNLRKRGAGLLDSLGLSASDFGAGTSTPTTSSRQQGKRKTQQNSQLSGIPEDEVVQDLLVIRRATGVTGPLGPGGNGKKSSKGSKR